MTGDTTPEALVGLLAEQGGRMAAVSAEAGIFETLGGRYTAGVANLDGVLQAHAGDPIRVDRRNRAPEHVDRPVLTIALMAQPQALAAIGASRDMRGRGLFARFLYAVPASKVGQRRVDAPPVPDTVSSAWGSLLTSLVGRLHALVEPAVLTLGADAQRAYLAHERDVESRLGPDGDLGAMPEWGGKYVGATVRLAALLHMAVSTVEEALSTPISGTTYAAAVQFGDFFVAHARIAFDLLGDDRDAGAAEQVLDFLRRRRVERFTERDLFRDLGPGRVPHRRQPEAGSGHPGQLRVGHPTAVRGA